MKAARNPLIAKIHIGKQQLGLDDDTYRGLLQLATGKTSCSKMNHAELESVLKAMQDRGFQPVTPSKRGRFSPASRNKAQADKTPLDKLRAVWIQMGIEGHIRDSSETALIRWVKRQTCRMNGGIGIDSLEWLAQDSDMLRQIIEALKGWRIRLLKKRDIASSGSGG